MLCKQLDLCVSRMTASNGGPVPSRRLKNSVFNAFFSCLFLFCLVFVFETIVQSFCLRITWEKPPLFPQLYTFTVPGKLLGTLRSDDGDGNWNATKAIGFISKTTILHAHHAFFFHDAQRKYTSDDEISSLFLNLDMPVVLRNSTLGGFTYI